MQKLISASFRFERATDRRHHRDRDITIRAVAKGWTRSVPVREVMTQEVFTCPAASDALVACALMEEQLRAPAGDGDGRGAGRHRLPG
jgi:hypothetical protein